MKKRNVCEKKTKGIITMGWKLTGRIFVKNNGTLPWAGSEYELFSSQAASAVCRNSLSFSKSISYGILYLVF